MVSFTRNWQLNSPIAARWVRGGQLGVLLSLFVPNVPFHLCLLGALGGGGSIGGPWGLAWYKVRGMHDGCSLLHWVIGFAAGETWC